MREKEIAESDTTAAARKCLKVIFHDTPPPLLFFNIISQTKKYVSMPEHFFDRIAGIY